MIPLLGSRRRDALMADIEDDAGEMGRQPDPRAKLMQEVAEQMDAIETDFGDNYEIGRVITIVEVTGPDGNVGLRLRAGQYPWVTIGMLDFAKKSLEAQIGG
jgi:hypothetical protein